MSSKAPLLLVILALIVGGVLWFLLGGGAPTGPRVQDPPATVAGPPGEAGVPPAEPDAPMRLEEAAPIEETRRTAARERARHERASGDHESFDTADAHWVEVTVLLPAGVPADDAPALLAFSKIDGEQLNEWEGRQIAEQLDLTDAFAEGLQSGVVWARRELAGSGPLRVPLAANAQSGVLLLQSRYVHAPPTPVTPEDSQVTIEGELGAYVTGRCVIPPRAAEHGVEPDDIELEFQGRSRKGGFFGGFWEQRAVRLNDDFSFELRALSASAKYIVHAQADGLADFIELSFVVEAGEHRELEIPLAAGARISGRILGEGGQPVPGASVGATTQGMFFMGGNREEASAGADGSYLLTGVAAGEVKIGVQAEGWLSQDDLSLDVTDGQEVVGFDVVLERGNQIAGVVHWPDGRPAEKADVGATVMKKERGWGNNAAETKTDDEGHFVLSGLLDGPFEVRAEAEPAGEKTSVIVKEVEGLSALGYVDQTPSNAWKAIALDVAPNTTGLQLVLQEPLDFPGLVVDDTGAPIERFQIQARPEPEPEWSPDQVAQNFESEDGSFRLSGLFPGRWVVQGEAEGHSPTADPIPITIPYAGDPLVIALERGGSLAGIVVDPFGEPVEAADVSANSGSRAPFVSYSQSASATTDADGRFAFERVPLAGLLVTADHEDWAASEETPIELAPGETLDDLVIRLRLGGTITGEVYDEEGRPDVGQQVSAGADNFGFGGGDRDAVTDDAGRFTIEHVTPGRVVITAMPGEEDILEAVQESGGEETAMINFLGRMRMKTIEVADGEEVHVVLGTEPKAPVRVHGLVSEAGEPLADVSVFVIEEGGAFLQGIKASKTDEHGRYEVVVDRPGDFVFNLGLEGMFGGGSIPFYVDVPEAEAFELDMEVPLGRISGRVFGPDGAPAAGVALQVSRSGGVFGMADLDQSNTRGTSATGDYVFDHLHPGVYAVRVGGFSSFLIGENVSYGASVVDGIELARDESVDGIDFQLSTPGKLAGIVRDAAGNPVGDAAIFVHDEAGRVVSNISACITDAGGRFTHQALSPGPITVSARSEELTSRDSAAVEITAGETTEIELVVEPGTYLIVSLLDQGELVRARVQVLDDEGRQVNGLLSAGILERFLTEGFSSKERRIGPVPPGRYTLIATTEDGKDARKTVTVRAGQGERRVRLRLR